MQLKHNIISLMCAVSVMPVAARDIKSIWKTVPDSVVLAVDKVRRLEMLDLVDYNVKAEVNNRFGSTSVMDTITSSYLHVTMGKSSGLSMRLLPTAEGDTLVCLLTTFKAPEAESTINFYTPEWQCLEASRYLPFVKLSDVADSLICRPDTMSAERYSQLCSQIVVPLVSASSSVTSSDLELALSLPMLPVDERGKVEALLVRRKLVWTGRQYGWQK